MELDATPTRRKRALSDLDDEAPTPASLKKRRLDDVNGDSPSTPKALSAIASAISGAFGFGRPAHKPAVNGQADGLTANGSAPAQAPPAQPPVLAKPAPRPAIKLAALRGSIWDTGEAPKPRTTPKKTAASKRASPAKQRLATKGATAVGGYESTDELSGADQTTPSAHKFFSPKHAAGSPGLKGILTPTKNRGPRALKNVSFNGNGKGNGEVFFEDLPKGTPKKTKTPNPRRSRNEPAEDEIVCEICSRPDSKAPNQIILCDHCDFAVHQECYEVPEIPTGDWLCKSCAQEDVLKTPSNAIDAAPATAKAVEVPDVPNLDQHMRSHQRVLLDRCAGRRRIQMFGQDEVYEKARQLVEQTVVAGEGNSMLLIGARGSGKTTLVENVITDLSREHRHEFHVVRLNGFIHTDDKLALKEIWRQLGKEMDVGDDLVNRTNYADTMASLLALLSHPSEILGTAEGITSQSVVFIIDEFDLFAAHPRQTLLYNLFDIAQSRKAPVAVLGCTTRLDVVEMLEKRVKSRFSHRYVYLSLPRTLPAYWQICRQGLMVDKPDAAREGIDVDLEGYDEFRKYWNHKIEELYKQRPFQDLLQYHFYTTKSASAFFTEWMLPLSSISATDLTLPVPSAGSEATSLPPPDSRIQLLSALSDLDLGLLIAAARLDIVAHTDTVNFAMAYDEYSSLVGRQRVQSATAGLLATGGGVRVWSRGVAGIAWERLIGLGLLVPAGIGGGGTLGHGGLDGKMWKVDVALEEIPTGAKLSVVLARWCKEI